MTGATVESFVPGFIGVPGDRAFYIQIVDAGVQTSYLLEKGQVAGLALNATRLLTEIGQEGAGVDLVLPGIEDPAEVRFRVGELNIGYEESTGVVSVTLVPTTEGTPPVVFFLTPAQLDAAAQEGAEIVGAGRPPCPRCGLAMDPDGHVCPTTNGDLRNHRP